LDWTLIKFRATITCTETRYFYGHYIKKRN
jgi:hypothetical protein